MILRELTILNYKNIREATLQFSDKINCFVGKNGQGKTNLLDAIYMLSFTKSAFNLIDSQNITHGEDLAMIQGEYEDPNVQFTIQHSTFKISCGLKRGQKKQLRLDQKEYQRLTDHIGLIPLVMVCPQDAELIEEGSESRRRFMDSILGQCDKVYLDNLMTYNALLKQRNALLKQLAENEHMDCTLLEVFEQQMIPLAQYIHQCRKDFIARFIPSFQEIYSTISNGEEQVSLVYQSQLLDRDLQQAYERTRARDIILGWTTQGVHKDDLDMRLGDFPLKQVASQGQQKTYLLALKLAQSLFLEHSILLLDDIFDKLDGERVTRIIQLVQSDRFDQIFITDTDRQHLTSLLGDTNARIFHVEKGVIQ